MSDFKIMNDPLYDDSYPMKLLEQAFEMQVEQAEKATNKLVSDILKSQEYDPLKLSEGKEKMRLVVDGSDDFIKDYHPQIFWIPNKFDLAKAGSFFEMEKCTFGSVFVPDFFNM